MGLHRRQPDDVRLDMHLGDMALADGDLAAAERHGQAVLARRPQSVVTPNNLAQVPVLRKRPGAAAMARQALALAPDTPALTDTLALCLAVEQQWRQAIDWQTRAVAAAPDAPQFRLQPARLYLQSGDKPGARGELLSLAALGAQFAQQTEVADLMRRLEP